jgi:hypothetical protein
MKTLSRLMLANFINDLVLGGLIHFISTLSVAVIAAPA